MPPIARKTLAITLASLVVACAGPKSEYPSLSIREAERVEGQFSTGEPARIDVPKVDVDLSENLGTRLDALVASARDAHADFLASTPRARELVMAAGDSEVGSDHWAAAQVALAELDSARSRAAIPLGDLDTLYAAARVSVEDVRAIDAARDQVIGLVSEEDAVLSELRARVR